MHIVQEYLVVRPDYLQYPVAKLVAQAFVKTFPCPPGQISEVVT